MDSKIEAGEKAWTQATAAKIPDGRSKRRTGRTAQMNLKMRQDLRDEVEAMARSRGILMVEIIEQAFEFWKANRGVK